MSFWERVGEVIGYGMAAVVLGPIDAVTRHERRVMRKSFVAWTRSLDAIAMTAPKPGVVRRAVTLRTSTGGMPATAEIDLFARRARIEASIATLPSFVSVMIARGFADAQRRSPIAQAGSMAAFSDTLDAESTRAILANIESAGLGALTHLEVSVSSKELVVRTIAMTTEDAWRSIGDGVSVLADFLAERWPASYRS